MRDPYTCAGSKGVGIGPAVDGGTAGTSVPNAATPHDALADLATSGAPAMTTGSIPSEGWVERRGRWVHDLSPDTFYEATLLRVGNGWRVTSYRLCSR